MMVGDGISGKMDVRAESEFFMFPEPLFFLLLYNIQNRRNIPIV